MVVSIFLDCFILEDIGRSGKWTPKLCHHVILFVPFNKIKPVFKLVEPHAKNDYAEVKLIKQ